VIRAARTLVSGIVLLTAFWLPETAFAAPRPLRIATFNLEWLTESAHETRMAPWKDEGELAAHRAALARILARDVRADVLCVLEATSRAALDKLVAEPALRKSGYRVLHLESGDTGTGQDVAFLVRVPVDAFAGAEIRRFGDAPESDLPQRAHARLTKHAVVCLSSGSLKVCVMGLHLLAHPDDRGRTARRETQARIAARIVRDEITAKGYLPIVVGDFNDFDPEVAVPEGTKGKRKVLGLVKNFDPARKGPELFNAMEQIEPMEERYSAYWDKNKNDQRDVGEPVSLIDHILLDNALSARLVKVEILHASHDGSVSDHWPLVVELQQYETGRAKATR
jgi:exonuclease III